MAEIVSLRMARKQKARSEKERAAEQNRIRYGTTKAERQASQAKSQREEAAHEGHRRERSKPDGER
jgi:hypothetical protein